MLMNGTEEKNFKVKKENQKRLPSSQLSPE
jgi:hypothetical protein